MKKTPAIVLALIVCGAIFFFTAQAQEAEEIEINVLKSVLTNIIGDKVQYQLGDLQYYPDKDLAIGTNGIYINYGHGEAVLIADTVVCNYKTYDVEADGHVRIESTDMLWMGEHIRYNFKTHVIQSEQFRTGFSPVFAEGAGLNGFVDPKKGATNVVIAKQAYLTIDDYSDPSYQIHATTIKIIPGKKVQMWNAVAYVEGVPVFYFPYYQRNIGPRANNLTSTPGYRSRYGGYLLNTYNWYMGDEADGKIHMDYRVYRGPGVGPDVNLHLGRWGNGTIKYYYVYDTEPNYSTNVYPYFGKIPNHRQRFYTEWQATPATNLNVKAMINYQSDPLVMYDYFESAYTYNPQPNTFVEANKYWENWSLDALATPRINSFFNQVERLPDVKLTGFNQQVFETPVVYNSESSVGWYRAWDANATNGLYGGTNGFYAFTGARADTYHQLTLPWTFFNWLNVTPRVGGRLTYYSTQGYTNGTPSSDVTRGVFNSGVDVSFKASQLWADATNSILQVDGLRHILQPSVNYIFVPDPSVPPAQLPQYDPAFPSLVPLPVMFPDYNSVDSIDTMNVIRFGLENILQTKRGGQLDDLVNWNVMLDWRLNRRPTQNNFNDLYSALSFKPRTWLAFESQVRYDLDGGNLDLAFHQVTFAPNDRWSWGLSHWYMRRGFVSPFENDFIASTLYYRVNDNWGLRAAHIFNAQTGRLQEQDYTIFRDLRSWTAALTFRAESSTTVPTDFTVAFSLSLKAIPATHVGDDALNASRLVGE